MKTAKKIYFQMIYPKQQDIKDYLISPLYQQCVFLLMSVAYISNGNINVNLILNPKLLYYTPGLWERTGVPFWGGFLFETPFALGRSIVFLIPLIAVFYVYLAIKARMLYNKGKKSN